jgi:hypothetical protein
MRSSAIREGDGRLPLSILSLPLPLSLPPSLPPSLVSIGGAAADEGGAAARVVLRAEQDVCVIPNTCTAPGYISAGGF